MPLILCSLPHCRAGFMAAGGAALLQSSSKLATVYVKDHRGCCALLKHVASRAEVMFLPPQQTSCSQVGALGDWLFCFPPWDE